MLSEKNKFVHDERISSGPGGYVLDGEPSKFTRVSAFYHKFFPKFDKEAISNMMAAAGDKFLVKYPKYRGFVKEWVSKEDLAKQIVEAWTAFADLGTEMHRYIELDLNDLPQENDTETKEKEYYRQWKKEVMQKGGFVPFRTEWILFDESSELNGTCDFVMYHPETDTYHLVDWKRVDKIHTYGFGKWGLGPCKNMQDCNFEQYSCQQGTYKYMIEKNYGIAIETMRLVVLHPNNPTYAEFFIDGAKLMPVIKEMALIHNLF